jgi:hypothetical protein
MGKSSVAAVVAVFLAVVTIALWLAAESPTSTFQPDPNLEQRGLPGVQARHTRSVARRGRWNCSAGAMAVTCWHK